MLWFVRPDYTLHVYTQHVGLFKYTEAYLVYFTIHSASIATCRYNINMSKCT